MDVSEAATGTDAFCVDAWDMDVSEAATGTDAFCVDAWDMDVSEAATGTPYRALRASAVLRRQMCVL